MTPFTFKDFKQLVNGLPIECETISKLSVAFKQVGDQLIDRVICTKENDGWHIDMHPVQEE